MNHDIHDTEIIERYFDNDLTEQEKTHFHDRLKTDTELKKMFDREKLLINAIRFEGTRNNLQYLKELDASLPASASTYNTRRLYYYAAAACLALLVVAGIFIPFGNASSEELFAEYFTPYENVFEPTVRGSDEHNFRREAFHAYESGNYQEAAKRFSTLLKENKNSGMLLLLGNSNLALGNVADASANFNDLILNYDDLDVQGKWFLSLCYLKMDNPAQARQLLTELTQTDTSYASRARELLKKLD